MPVWATLIGLMAEDEVMVGVVSAPALGRRWWAASGGGAWTGRSLTKATPAGSPGWPASRTPRCRTRACPPGRTGRLDEFLGLAGVWRTRAYGDFWSHMLVAEGAVDISAETDV